MSATMNPSKGGSLKWAWRLLDRHRNRDHIDGNQIKNALKAIANVHGRAPLPGDPSYRFDDEIALRGEHVPR